MFDLSATDRVKLKAIIAAGGLRDLRDILRISMAPEHAGDAAQWHLYLERNHDNLQSWVEQVCDPRDIVALNENVLTIIRHPGSLIPSEALRMDVITRLSDRLRGHATLQLPKLTFTSEPVGGAMAWLSDAVKSAAVSLAHPGADSASDETAHAARIAAEGLNAETPEAAQFWCQAVVCSDGGAALFLRLPARDRLDLRRLHLSGKDQAYFSPGDISLDLAAIEQVIQLAQRQLDAKRSPLLPLLLPLNINNLRQSERRRQLLQDLRDVPSELSQMIEPVFVRCVDGIPQSAFVDAAAYLRPTFPNCWIFVRAGIDPAKFKWPEYKIGVLIDGMAEIAINARLRKVAEWRKFAALYDTPMAFLASERGLDDPDFDDVSDTIYAAL